MHQNEVILMSNGFDMVNRILREFVQPPLMKARSECRCVRRAEIEEAPDDGNSGQLALPIFRK